MRGSTKPKQMALAMNTSKVDRARLIAERLYNRSRLSKARAKAGGLPLSGYPRRQLRLGYDPVPEHVLRKVREQALDAEQDPWTFPYRREETIK